MTAEHIHDALNHLPDDLLEAADAIRCRKRFPLRSVAALAACACIALGLWFFFPHAGMDSAVESGTAVEDRYHSESTTEEFLTAIVVSIEQEHLLVSTGPSSSAIAVYLDTLEEAVTLTVGQQIRIYCHNTDEGSGATSPGLHPYRIEIIQN